MAELLQSYECHQTLMISQHSLMQWFGAIRQEAITWSSVDQDLWCHMVYRSQWVNALRPRQNGCHFPDDISKCIFINENVWFPIKISLKFVPKGIINNISSLVQIMAWRRPGGKPLSELIIISLQTHICVARPQWVDIEYNNIQIYMYHI